MYFLLEYIGKLPVTFVNQRDATKKYPEAHIIIGGEFETQNGLDQEIQQWTGAVKYTSWPQPKDFETGQPAIADADYWKLLDEDLDLDTLKERNMGIML